MPNLRPVALAVVYRAMREEGISDSFATSALVLAREYEGIKDLLHLWYKERSSEERTAIVGDIQDLMNDYLVSHLRNLVKMG